MRYQSARTGWLGDKHPSVSDPGLAHTLSQGQAPTTHPKDEGAAFLVAQFFSQMGGGGRAKPVFPTSPPRGLGELLSYKGSQGVQGAPNASMWGGLAMTSDRPGGGKCRGPLRQGGPRIPLF